VTILDPGTEGLQSWRVCSLADVPGGECPFLRLLMHLSYLMDQDILLDQRNLKRELTTKLAVMEDRVKRIAESRCVLGSNDLFLFPAS
jgi:hypothetical protein